MPSHLQLTAVLFEVEASNKKSRSRESSNCPALPSLACRIACRHRPMAALRQPLLAQRMRTRHCMQCAALLVLVTAVLAPAATATSTDVDGDGVPDGWDACPDTPLAAVVDANGCDRSQVDPELDGVCNLAGVAAVHAFVFPSVWCSGDDNCNHAYNPDQADYNANGIGDACDLGACVYATAVTHHFYCSQSL